MRHPRNQLTLAAVALVLGFLVVLQLRTQTTGSQLDSLSAQELTELVANLNVRNDQLRSEIASLNSQVAELESGQESGTSSLTQLRADTARIRGWAGLDPLVGSGITVTISGPITGGAVEDLLNELRNAGAEGLAVNGVRIVSGSVVAGDADSLSVENSQVPDPFDVTALGNPEILTGSLTRSGGIIAQLRATFPDVDLTVTPVDRLVLPATSRNLTPQDGRPRL